MRWDEAAFGIGVDEMDATHREFVSFVAAVAVAPTAEFPALFEQVRQHTRKHFEREYALMLACNRAA